eukprot:1058271-Rhodomonas_salina.1
MWHNHASGRRTKKRTQKHWGNKVTARQAECVRRCRLVVPGWTVLCHMLLTGAPCLNVCKIVSNKFEHDEKTHE